MRIFTQMMVNGHVLQWQFKMTLFLLLLYRISWRIYDNMYCSIKKGIWYLITDNIEIVGRFSSCKMQSITAHKWTQDFEPFGNCVIWLCNIVIIILRLHSLRFLLYSAYQTGFIIFFEPNDEHKCWALGKIKFIAESLLLVSSQNLTVWIHGCIHLYHQNV